MYLQLSCSCCKCWFFFTTACRNRPRPRFTRALSVVPSASDTCMKHPGQGPRRQPISQSATATSHGSCLRHPRASPALRFIQSTTRTPHIPSLWGSERASRRRFRFETTTLCQDLERNLKQVYASTVCLDRHRYLGVFTEGFQGILGIVPRSFHADRKAFSVLQALV